MSTGTGEPSVNAGRPLHSLLIALKVGDSFFPSGASAFSWGLESLQLDGHVTSPAQIEEFAHTLISHRWAGFDRPLIRAAYTATAALDASSPTKFAALIELDQLCESMSLSTGAREASRRLGFTQLRVHGALGLGIASEYLDAVRSEAAHGHLPVMQGFVWSLLGIAHADAEGIAAFGMCTSVAGAAIRLGMLGHLDSQRLLASVGSVIERELASAAVGLDDIWTGTPGIDIASLRHEPRSARLFAN